MGRLAHSRWLSGSPLPNGIVFLACGQGFPLYGHLYGALSFGNDSLQIPGERWEVGGYGLYLKGDKMVLYGYGQILDVDLSTGHIVKRDMAPEFAQQYVGGMGFGVRILYDVSFNVTRLN